MNRQEIEAWYFSHPIIVSNMKIKMRLNEPYFKNENEKARSIAKFCLDYGRGIIQREDIKREYGKIIYHGFYIGSYSKKGVDRW